MVTVPAMLPLYQRAAMSPLSLTCITALAAGTMNMLPWGGPTTRAATALQVSATELFVPVIPAMLVGLVGVFLLRAGTSAVRERARLANGPAFLDCGRRRGARRRPGRTRRSVVSAPARPVGVQCTADRRDAGGALR